MTNLLRRLAGLLLAAVLLLASCGAPAECELLVLMYHHIDDVGDNSVTVSADTFGRQLDLLQAEGYTTVSPAELVDYAERGKPLPDKPVCIVFDDGYESNFTLAMPALAERGMTASVCVIGWSVGKDVYKHTGVQILPHFTWEQAREMEESGVFTVGSHTYDMHQNASLEGGRAREAAVPLPDETEENFAADFRADHALLASEMEAALGHGPLIFAYPHGRYCEAAEEILRDAGVRVTFITEVGRNTVRRGDADSLRLLRRYSINEHTDFGSILNPPETTAGTEGVN